MFVRFLFAFDVVLLILLRTARWSTAGKQLSSWLSTCAGLLYAVLIALFLSRLMSWAGYSTVSVPDHCLFIYSDMLQGHDCKYKFSRVSVRAPGMMSYDASYCYFFL